MPLLSVNACQRLNLIKLCNVISAVESYDEVDITEIRKILDKYKEVSKGIGSINKEVSLTLNEHAKPVVQTPEDQ